MRVFVSAMFVISIAFSPIAFAGTCKGSSSCTACKNCAKCKHCSTKGNSCGVCAKKTSGKVAVK